MIDRPLVKRRFVGTSWKFVGVHCATASCNAELEITPCGRYEKVFESARGQGWSTFNMAPGTRRAWVALYCPTCTADRAGRDDLCRYCTGGGLYELAGHSSDGHRIANALYRYGIGSVEELRKRSDELCPGELPGLGVKGIAQVKRLLADIVDEGPVRPDEEPTP